MRGNSVSIVLRRVLLQRPVSFLGSSRITAEKNPSFTFKIILIINLRNSLKHPFPIIVFPPPPLKSPHFFSSREPSAHPQMVPCVLLLASSSNIVLIKSGEEFNSSLSKAKDESMPALFYFTAVWCGPCKFLFF
ncbi:hypothetical protein Patl1_12245 [Pistacia atlantica]|uniref:Uncharacterized protein n=1 Tax=Pistacia atlantica TaxID=434234 RepID=A0ACC1A5N0_9ROSI|nr:hypothetical protein Patl1_12245 [Pistacia atlantica]